MQLLTTFIDKKARNIAIYFDDLCIVAKHNGAQVGHLSFDEPDTPLHGQIKLMDMNVETLYRRAGIARQMMICAAEQHGKGFDKPRLSSVGGNSMPASEYYTQEGQAFIWHCIEQGILDDSDSE